MRLHISAVVLGLLLSGSGGTATPSGDISTGTSHQHQQQHQNHQQLVWHEPPAWDTAFDNVIDDTGRRLGDDGSCSTGISPYDFDNITTTIGSGTERREKKVLSLLPPEGRDEGQALFYIL